MRGLFEITHERVSQFLTYVNSKLKSLVLNGLRREIEDDHPLKETEAPQMKIPLLSLLTTGRTT